MSESDGDVVPAGLLRRLAAMLYDGLMVVAIWMFTLILIVPLANGPVGGAPLQSLFFVELFAFQVYFWLTRGQTIGMLAWRLRIESVTGDAMRLPQLTIRFFTSLLALACIGIGYLWMLFDRERRSWGDIASRTRIVRVRG
jgi:uncharacterized RDD family membrane protein YckC